MSHPVTIEPRMQKDSWDCGLACLEMLTGVPYAELRKLVRAKNPVGLSSREIRSIAKRAGHPLMWRKGTPDEEAVGILDLQRPVDAGDLDGEWEGHYAIYAKDTVYNPAQGVWWTDLEAFLKAHRWDVVGLHSRRD